MADKFISKVKLTDDSCFLILDKATKEYAEQSHSEIISRLTDEITSRTTKDETHDSQIEELQALVRDLYNILNQDCMSGIVYFKDQPISKLYCGSSDPQSDIGNNGDIYIKY